MKSEVQMNIKRLIDIGTYRGKGTEEDYLLGVKEPRQMPEPEKAREKLLQEKKKLRLRSNIKTVFLNN